MNRWSRRNFIKTSATAALTIPFLESIPSIASAANASGSLKRILFYCLSNAQYQDILMPTSTNYLTGAEGVRYIPLNSFSGDISRIFTAAKYGNIKSKMNIMRGFDVLAKPGEIAGGHNVTFALGACGGPSFTLKDSIDTIISNASQFYTAAPFKKFLNALPMKDGRPDQYNYSFQGGNQRPILGGPTNIFTEFFSETLPSATGGGAITTPTDTNLSRRLAMNAVMSKMSALVGSSKLSANDKMKLSQHAEFINKLLPKLALPVAGTGGATPGGSCAKPSIVSGINESASSSAGNQARLRACLDQIYMAFNCQLTNMSVIHPVVAYDTGNWDMGDSGNDEYHQLAGHYYDVNKYLKYNGWVYDQLLYLLNMMESTKESNGLTMLDNSLVVVVSNDACSIHSFEDMPVITFGSLGGTIKTGNYINYQRVDAPAKDGVLTLVNGNDKIGYYHIYNYNLGRPLGSLYTTILNALKIPHSGFGSYIDPNGNYKAFTTAAAKQTSLPIIS